MEAVALAAALVAAEAAASSRSRFCILSGERVGGGHPEPGCVFLADGGEGFRLNSAIGYIAPKDMLAGHQQEIHAERDRKLEAAREQRKNRRQQAV